MYLRAFFSGPTVLATASLVAAPALAQQDRPMTVKRYAQRINDRTVVSTRDEDGRRRTRVIVQRRSFLDAGTQVLPGERKFTDYAIPPTGRSAISPAMNNTAFTWENQIMPGPFDLPGQRNPRQW